jgi:hypothetical protein
MGEVSPQAQPESGRGRTGVAGAPGAAGEISEIGAPERALGVLDAAAVDGVSEFGVHAGLLSVCST